MHIAQLMASPFFGGPERQMLGLALALPGSYRTSFLSFSERGLCRPFLEVARSHGYAGIELKSNFPAVRQAVNEIARQLSELDVDILCCSGYKPDIIGWLVGRKAGLPVVSISHGWTGASWKVRLYEALDRVVLRWMNAIVCVSEGQAVKVRRTGAPGDRIRVIRNAVSLEKFGDPNPAFRDHLQEFFRKPQGRIIVAAGRLSPEKGFARLVEAAALLLRSEPDIGVVIFGDGPLRGDLTRQIADLGLQDHVVLAGFHGNIEDFLPHADLVALPSYTEGLPVIALEALAARVPVVATSVGGVPEVVEDGISGFLVPPGDAAALALRFAEVLSDENMRVAMGRRGRLRVEEQFTFPAQSVQYQRLFEELVEGNHCASTTSLAHASTS
jgi:glycosyltransferase involved in cell wall biosynthesis